MKVAVPLFEGAFFAHFGHADSFALIEVDKDDNIVERTDVPPPPHEHGVLPAWLAELGVNVVLAGGMGAHAVSLFEERGVFVVTGIKPDAPEALVAAYLNGMLETADNSCNHDHGGDHHHHDHSCHHH